MKFNRGENLYLESVKDGYACRAPTIIHLPVLPVLSVLPVLPMIQWWYWVVSPVTAVNVSQIFF